jgi:hypothetical protein
MKGKIPCGIPRIFPFIGHGNNIGIVKMIPLAVATRLRSCGGGGRCGSPRNHTSMIVIIKLFTPQHAGQRLPLNHFFFFGRDIFLQLGIIRVGFGFCLRYQLYRNAEMVFDEARSQPQIESLSIHQAFKFNVDTIGSLCALVLILLMAAG